jgi:hypothetical protein
MMPAGNSKEAFERKIAELEKEIAHDENLFMLIMWVIIVGVSAAALIWGRG